LLFRKEVIKAKEQRMLGRVIMTQPLSIYVICIVVFVVYLLLSFYLTQAHYSRKETVKGYLIPEKGVMKVYSNRTGVIEYLYVKEGDKVMQGDNLVKIKNSQSLSSGVELSVALAKELSTQIDTLNQEYDATTLMYEKDLLSITRQLTQLYQSLKVIEKAQKTRLRKLALKKRQITNNKRLYDKGYLSSNQFDLLQGEYLDDLESSDRLEKELVTIQIQISELESERLIYPEQKILKQSAIKRQISELAAQLAELKNQYEFIKKAPETGIVTTIQPTVGSRVDINAPLLSIIAIDSPLEIELLLPSRSAGFVQVGDKVNIRFDAFPYQKFGLVVGEISNIDKSLILPAEKILPIQIDQAMYRVRASLNQQSIKAYGKAFPLKVGMIADADIILEKRSLLEWLLDPIYAVKGKL